MAPVTRVITALQCIDNLRSFPNSICQTEIWFLEVALCITHLGSSDMLETISLAVQNILFAEIRKISPC